MVTRKATGAGASVRRHNKTTNSPIAFIWKPRDWTEKKSITGVVSLMVNKTNYKQLVVKKVIELTANSARDHRPTEIRALAMLPDCNRVAKALIYSPADPDVGFGTAIFQHYPFGDLVEWKESQFDEKNNKPIPESYIWRLFVHMSQALAFIQNHLGPDRDKRHCLLHRDIKPKNILVVDNGTTYPSFKLHDFGIATMYQQSKARRPSRVGTYEWQAPENPVINTVKAEIWSLGACVHYLAVGKAPLQSVSQYTIIRWNENNRHPHSAQLYNPPARYYAAQVPREITPINLSRAEQEIMGIAPYANSQRAPYNHQYSDELNEWMTLCLSRIPSRRPTAVRLIHGMSLVAEGMLQRMGGKTALADLDIKFGKEV